jgi:hypothetical protein
MSDARAKGRDTIGAAAFSYFKYFFCFAICSGNVFE